MRTYIRKSSVLVPNRGDLVPAHSRVVVVQLCEIVLLPQTNRCSSLLLAIEIAVPHVGV